MTEIAIGDAPRHGPFPGTLDPQSIAAYAAATHDRTTAVLSGDAVPVVFPVVLVFQAQEAANADIPDAAWRQATGGVHGEHDLVLHRALAPGEALQTWSRLSAVRTTRAGTKVVLHIEQFDSGGALVVEQWWTTMLLGLHGIADIGSMPADHRIPEGARAHPLGSRVQHIDGQVAHRYAEVSGDWSAHHFDIDAARRAGFDFLFAHGLCTMAICTHHVLALAGVDNPGRVRRAAVRFASPTPLGADLTVSAFGIDKRSVGFEASCNGTHVIARTGGVAGLSPPAIGVYACRPYRQHDASQLPHFQAPPSTFADWAAQASDEFPRAGSSVPDGGTPPPPTKGAPP